MKKIAAGLFISLDGVVEAPDQWHFPYFNDEMGAAVDAQLGAADTLLLGCKTYDSFAGPGPSGRRPVGRTPTSPRRSATPARSSCRTSSWSSPGATPPLKLISSETFETGVLNLVYAPAWSPGDAGYEDAKAHLSQPDA
jgi:hypothetical protein